MKPRILALAATGALAPVAPAQTILFADNFNVANTTNFDAAPLTGRRSGLGAADIRLRSWGFQQDINNQQLYLPAGGNNGVRFEAEPGPFGGGNRYDWGAGAIGALILDNSNFVVSFDWTPPNNTTSDWVSFQVGTVNADSANLTNDDFGILFRGNGATQYFPGGNVGGTLTPAPAGGVTRHVEITYITDSFATGQSVRAIMEVDGQVLVDDTRLWEDGPSGSMYMELGTNFGGHFVDNLTVWRRDPVSIDDTAFDSGDPIGTPVGTLTGAIGGLEGPTTFALVAGAGDTDNGLFQISGNELQVNSDFTGANSVDGQQFFVRVQGTDNGSLDTAEVELVLTVTKDDDLDGIPDPFELAERGNITDLNGLGAGPGPGATSGDFDGDGLLDIDEYNLIVSTYPFLDISVDDSDADTLLDGAEVAGAGSRPPTNPTLADTDADGLDDDVETNTDTFVSASDTGSDPTLPDSDSDGLGDLFETNNNPPYDPNVDNSADDFDSDGLDVTAELAAGTDVLLDDTDSDNLIDGDEVNGLQNPYQIGAVAGDAPTVAPGAPTNPLVADSDGDGIDDDEEVVAGADTFITNPNLADTDGDGASDGDEVGWGGPYSPVVDNSADGDTDGDTLTFAEEVAAGTNPTLADTDSDNLDDLEELFPTGFRPPTNPLLADTDLDGLNDDIESNTLTYVDPSDTGTNPTDPDTDDDGARDSYEVVQGTDPFDPVSFPAIVGAGVSVQKLLSEELSGISPTKTYTHAIAGSEPATVNGVVFDVLDPGLTPPNFNWDTETYQRSQIDNNNGGWVPNVTGSGLLDLFDSFTYSGNGNVANAAQHFTLSGLTPGEDYIFRFYIRAWDTAGSGRPIDLTLTNGAQVVTPYQALPEDRPGIVLGTGDNQDAYYLEFAYQAQGTELVIDTAIHESAQGTTGSFHMYGLTNEVAGDEVYAIGAVGDTFVSGDPVGTVVADLSGYFDAVPDPGSTFALVAGAGDTDNGLFQVVGSQLQVNADFTGGASVEGQQFFVRVQGTDGVGMTETSDLELVLTVSKDDDLDDLPDDWEISFAGNITTLGPDPADFDSDGLSDFEEYELSQSTYPLIDPMDDDSDNDGLLDGEEVFPTGSRPATDPTLADTDDDGLTDLQETNTGTFVDGNDTGSDPTQVDTDGDLVEDGVEVNNGSDPNDINSFLPSAIQVVEITSDATSGLDPGKTYTHKICGGVDPVTVNGVAFDTLTNTLTPPNFDWNTNGGSRSVVNNNLNQWTPATVGLDGTDMQQLLDSFTFSSGSSGSFQTYTLSGLTIGETYELRLYIRSWDPAVERLINFVVTNGGDVFDPMAPIPLDRPDFVLNNGEPMSAYYISYQYTANATSITLDAEVPSFATGSYHMYGMTNEVFGSGTELKVVDSGFIGSDFFIDVNSGTAGRKVTSSDDLSAPFTDVPGVIEENDGGGQPNRFRIPAAQLNAGRDFFRVEDQ
ncbi:hypothetical protein HAHE_18960 [Haloferula helveola]|uniref:Staphylococcus aureus surface protein A n=1 Tax=Haloferula helveola TaxID=490095 RepID=A0ABN6H335_9BACT|nr:hypothetical protein HAHE_18960 [Haloferula helveola]